MYLRTSSLEPKCPPVGKGAMVLALLIACVQVALTQPAGVDERPVRLQAENQRLSELLADLSDQIGAGVILSGTEDPVITLSVDGITFRQCMDTLADLCWLLASWQGEALVVRPLKDAVTEAERQLATGRTDALVVLSQLSEGHVPMYGTDKVRQQLSAALVALMQHNSPTVAHLSPGQPDSGVLTYARTGLPRESAAEAAIVARNLLWQGKTQEALRLWQDRVRGSTSWEATVLWAELLLVLHHSGSDAAVSVWEQGFSPNVVAQILREGWRQRAYRDALHLGRLNLSYALALGRMAQARAVQAAIQECLDAERVIGVTCVVDSEATGDSQWERKVRARVAKCSQVFQQAFGIRFEISEIIRWNPPSDDDFDRQYAALRAALGIRRPELTIGFILEVFGAHPSQVAASHKHLWTGYGCPHMGPYLLTRDFAFQYPTSQGEAELTLNSEMVAETLLHEMGHMFGALHSGDENSVMRPTSGGQPSFVFDELNAQIIRRRKWQDMALGVESLDEPELLGLVEDYRALGAACPVPNGSHEEEARVRLALAKLYQQRLDPKRAMEQLYAVLAIGVPPEVVRQAQRMLGAR